MFEKPTTGWCVDASTSGNPGPSEYKCVDLKTQEIIFHSKKFYSTNNIAEYIAVAHAIHACFERGEDTLFTDSITALSWIKKGTINTKLPRNKLTLTTWDMIGRTHAYLKTLEYNNHNDSVSYKDSEKYYGKVVFLNKWYTSEWGEIPADFGNK